MREWLLFNANSAIVLAISCWEQVHFQLDIDEFCFVQDKHAELDFFCARSLKKQSEVDISLHSDTLSCFRANPSLLFLFNAVCSGEKQQIPILLSIIYYNQLYNISSYRNNYYILFVSWFGVFSIGYVHSINQKEAWRHVILYYKFFSNMTSFKRFGSKPVLKYSYIGISADWQLIISFGCYIKINTVFVLLE